MFEKILLPVDLSNRHGPALEVAQNLARQNQGEIVILHVIELIAGLSISEEKGFYRKLEKTAEARLKKAGETSRAAKGAPLAKDSVRSSRADHCQVRQGNRCGLDCAHRPAGGFEETLGWLGQP
jgi:nucleotide-binding universal stress UspA family protein